MKKAATFLSILFHPLILPTYAIALIIVSNPYLFGNFNDGISRLCMMGVFMGTFLFPAISILLLKQLGFIKSFRMDDHQERYIPYICCMSFYFWAYVVFHKTNQPTIVSVMLLGSCITLAVVFVINVFTKVSAHTAAMGCLLALVLGIALLSSYNLIWIMLLTCLLAGLIGTSRLLLKAHDDKELYLGYVVGFMAQMIAFKFM